MDKWKTVVIVALLGALGSYGWYQQNAEQNPSSPDPSTPGATQAPPAPANEKLNRLKGQAPPAWNIAAPLWINTPSPISLDSLKGSVAIVEFWRIGCSHCEEAAPFLNALYVKNKARGLKMVALHAAGDSADPMNPENNWNIVQSKIKEWGITYPVANDVGGKLFKETYKGTTYPTLFILNRKGKIVYVQTGDTPQKQKLLVAEVEKQLKAK